MIPYRISQEQLKYIYESAKTRMEYNSERALKAVSIVNNYQHFVSEKEALEFAVQKMRKKLSRYQIWVKVEKGEDGIYSVQNWWLSTDDIRTIEAAEYIGMAQLYDASKILSVINADIPIDDVVAYY